MKKVCRLAANLASAYEPEVGVDKFVRRFSFSAPDNFEIDDTVRTVHPRKVTAYLHADNSIVKNGGDFEFEGGKSGLLVSIAPQIVRVRNRAKYTDGAGPARER
jgi:hypothetical protein